MYKYKCTSRSNLLILIDGKLREVIKDEEILSNFPINHLYLVEIKELKKAEKKITKKKGISSLSKIEVKKNVNSKS